MAAQQTDPQYKVRMPEELHSRLKAEAEANRRSMNAEIVARLEQSFEARPSDELKLTRGQKELFKIMEQDIAGVMKQIIHKWDRYADKFPDDGPIKYFDEDEKK